MPNPTLAVQKVENNFRKMVHDKFVPIQMEVAHLAKKLDVSGRSKMKKKELVDAIQKANDKKTASSRKK